MKRKFTFERGGYKYESEERERFPVQAQALLKYVSRKDDWVSEMQFGVDGDRIKYLGFAEDNKVESYGSVGKWRMTIIGTDEGLEDWVSNNPKNIVLSKANQL